MKLLIVLVVLYWADVRVVGLTTRVHCMNPEWGYFVENESKFFKNPCNSVTCDTTGVFVIKTCPAIKLGNSWRKCKVVIDKEEPYPYCCPRPSCSVA